MQEFSSTTKFANPDASGLSKIEFEAKQKYSIEWMKGHHIVGEGSMKNDGSHSVDGKCDLKEWTGVEGLKSFFHWQATRGDGGSCQFWKEGIDFKNDDLHCKILFDLCKKGKIIDGEGTYLVNKDLLVGDKGTIDLDAQKLTKYEAGLVWTPQNDFTVGAKHEFDTTGNLPSYGKFTVMFHHTAEAGRSLATEFVYNHLKQ